MYFLLQFLIFLAHLLKLQACEPSQNGLNERQLEEQGTTEEEHDVGLSSSGRPMGLEVGSLGEQHRCPPGFPRGNCVTKFTLCPLCPFPPSCPNGDHLPLCFLSRCSPGLPSKFTRRGCPRAGREGGRLLPGTVLWAVPDPQKADNQDTQLGETALQGR